MRASFRGFIGNGGREGRKRSDTGRPFWSNIREISFQLFDDEDTLDLDEGGLMAMYPGGDKWTAEVVFGHKDAANERLS